MEEFALKNWKHLSGIWAKAKKKKIISAYRTNNIENRGSKLDRSRSSKSEAPKNHINDVFIKQFRYR
jgi:hypothetical protein